MNTAAVESITPLSGMQQAFLFNSLRQQHDEGRILVECSIEGMLDPERFAQALSQTMLRHPALRSSAHWEDIVKPVQVVKHLNEAPLEYVDKSDLDTEEFRSWLDNSRNELAKQPLDLRKPPVMRFLLVKQRLDQHRLIWLCHHLFIDGWSTPLVLRDLVQFYQGGAKAIQQGLTTPKLFSKWVLSQDSGPATRFWSQLLDQTKNCRAIVGKTGSGGRYQCVQKALSLADSVAIRQQAKSWGVTLAGMFHAVWALVGARYTGSMQVCIGTTVSGRMAPLPNIEESVGMFANVMPIPVTVQGEMICRDWLQAFQTMFVKIAAFEQFGVVEVARINSSLELVMDSLVVVQNQPQDSHEGGDIRVRDLHSELATTFPLTIVMRPFDELEIDLIYREDLISTEVANWLIESVTDVLHRFSGASALSLEQVLHSMPHPPQHSEQQVSVLDAADFSQARSEIEEQLTTIWKEVLGISAVGLDHDFFEIGGRSIQAVRVFTMLSEELGERHSPTLLFEYPTIRALARALASDDDQNGGKVLVPLREQGRQIPLYCLHSGGGHVFFYRQLAQALNDSQPVYGVQPVGIDGQEERHETIEDMAAHYIREIKKIQPTGPYSFVGYCFSTTLCVEMARQFQRTGDSIGKIFIVDSPPIHMPLDTSVKVNFVDTLKSYVLLASSGNWGEIRYRLTYKFGGLLRRVFKFRAEHEVVNPDTEEAISDMALLDSQSVLARAFHEYEGEEFEGDISLIVAGPLNIRPWANILISQWQSIVRGRVDVHFVDGDHTTLFDQPTVAQLAAVIEDCLRSVR